MLCIALFAVAEGWLLFVIGWFVLFFEYVCVYIYTPPPPATKLGGGGILESPCPYVRPSVRLSGHICVSGA